MMKKVFLGLVLVLLLAGCTRGPGPDPPIGPEPNPTPGNGILQVKELVSNPQKYLNQNVKVEGFLAPTACTLIACSREQACCNGCSSELMDSKENAKFKIFVSGFDCVFPSGEGKIVVEGKFVAQGKEYGIQIPGKESEALNGEMQNTGTEKFDIGTAFIAEEGKAYASSTEPLTLKSMNFGISDCGGPTVDCAGVGPYVALNFSFPGQPDETIELFPDEGEKVRVIFSKLPFLGYEVEIVSADLEQTAEIIVNRICTTVENCNISERSVRISKQILDYVSENYITYITISKPSLAEVERDELYRPENQDNGKAILEVRTETSYNPETKKVEYSGESFELSQEQMKELAEFILSTNFFNIDEDFLECQRQASEENLRNESIEIRIGGNVKGVYALSEKCNSEGLSDAYKISEKIDKLLEEVRANSGQEVTST